jgi:hypothetical protein
VRGGSLPGFAWGALLAVLLIGCWIWTGDALQVGEFAFAVGVTWGGAVAYMAIGGRESARPGEPPARRISETIPTGSVSAALLGIAFASILYGFEFGRWLTYTGVGLLIAALGLLVREYRSERALRRQLSKAPEE